MDIIEFIREQVIKDAVKLLTENDRIFIRQLIQRDEERKKQKKDEKDDDNKD